MSLCLAESHIIYENPLPQLRSRQSSFPWLCPLPDGSLLAAHVLGEAFESVDGTTRLSLSRDGGRSFALLPPVYTGEMKSRPLTDYLKPTLLPDGRIALYGYEYFRDDPELPLGNPKTGGLLDDRLILMLSGDNGATFSLPREIPCVWGHHVEASAPLTVLQNGDWVTPITGFTLWDGAPSGPPGGRLLSSRDGGESWNDDSVTMVFPDPDVAVFEQRLCQLGKSGRIVVVAWNENLRTGERMNNHWAVSEDGGLSFRGPFDTGVRGQASCVCALEGDRLLALHAIRRDTDRPGIYGYVVNLANGRWDKESDPVPLWEPKSPVQRTPGMAEVFSFLKFGQPGAVRTPDGRILMSHWAAEDGQYRTYCSKLSL